MIDKQNEIFSVPPRRPTETQPISEVVAVPDRALAQRPDPIVIEAGTITVQIFPGDAVIVTVIGGAAATVRSGQMGTTLPLGKTQVIVRLDPTSGSSRATELVK
jgi:hypothetical protein